MLEFNAFHNPLTGLPNRTLLMEHLCGEIQRCARTRSMLAVFSIDIDEMEAESGTQHVSNQVIKLVAERLQQTVRGGDTVARLEGRRLVVVVPNLQAVGDACFAVQRLRQNFPDR